MLRFGDLSIVLYFKTRRIEAMPSLDLKKFEPAMKYKDEDSLRIISRKKAVQSWFENLPAAIRPCTSMSTSISYQGFADHNAFAVVICQNQKPSWRVAALLLKC